MKYFIALIIVLGPLIVIHELGHFIFAKLFRVKVLKFSVGFGPKLVGKLWGETEYLISAFPIGGYVKMLGENPVEEVEEEEIERSFTNKPVWQRFLIVAAGPIFNIIFAIPLYSTIVYQTGIPYPADSTEIAAVSQNSAAEEAGLQKGDIILSINGNATETWDVMSNYIQSSKAQPLTIVVKRGEETLEVVGKPRITEEKDLFGEVTGESVQLGILRKMHYRDATLLEAISTGSQQTWFFIYLTAKGLVKIVQNKVPASEIGGPIFIAKIAGDQLEAGWLSILSLMALITISLGVLNLLPIPILDGGHLVFFTLEAVRRKPLSMRAQEIILQIGLLILVTIFVFVFYNDIARVFFKG